MKTKTYQEKTFKNKDISGGNFLRRKICQEEDTPVRKRGTVLRAVSKRWPNGEVPYVLEDAFDENFRVCLRVNFQQF